MTNIIRVNAVHHTGISVRNLDTAVQFYKDLFGIEPVFIHDSSGPEIDRAHLGQLVNVPTPDIRFAFMKVGNTSFELMEYRQPRGKAFDRHNNDVGVMHLCFEVESIDATQATLKTQDITFTAEPIRLTSGPFAGCAFAYFWGHDGLMFEVFEVPKGL